MHDNVNSLPCFLFFLFLLLFFFFFFFAVVYIQGNADFKIYFLFFLMSLTAPQVDRKW